MIVSGEEIAIPTSTLSNLTSSTGVVGSTAAVQSSVEYKQVALQLEVVPLINSDREVSLDILQKLDSPSGATQNVGGSLIPTITTRYLRTSISLPNRATIVLGGLITKTVGGSSSALPLLGRIPLLGYFFGNKTKQSDRSELIVLIRPVVMTTPEELAQESHVARNKLLMEPDVDSTISPQDSTQSRGVNFRYQDNPDEKQVQ
jgi:type II secretory pathway component GspD/PulD (secretin)